MSKKLLFIPIWLLLIHELHALGNTACKACHPKIYDEYSHSIHANSSIYRDILHKTIWDKHPGKTKGNYSCAKCHTPSDHNLIEGKSKLTDNEIQRNEPISCQSCHQIESIEKHKLSNDNKYTDKKKYFYSADKEKKGSKLIFHKESSFFGLFTKTTGSPYHDIDYSNENYYNGESCMGCHSHKKGKNGFDICDLEVKQGNSQDTCISCHMPQAKGTMTSLKHTSTHSFHGTSIHNGMPTHLSRSIDLNLSANDNGFDIIIKNHANHTLFVHSLRLGQLRISIERDRKTISIKPIDFHRVIGKDGKPSMPWLADAVIEDTTIKAYEKRKIHFSQNLHRGDRVTMELGYYIVDPKMAKKLNIESKDILKLTTLVKKVVDI